MDNNGHWPLLDISIYLMMIVSQAELKDLWFELVAEIIDNAVPDLVCV